MLNRFLEPDEDSRLDRELGDEYAEYLEEASLVEDCEILGFDAWLSMVMRDMSYDVDTDDYEEMLG